MPGEAGGYLYTAISRIAISQTRFVFAKVMKGVSGYDAADFLDDLCENAPGKISSVKTTDHEAFTHLAGRPWEPKFLIGCIRSARPASQAVSAPSSWSRRAQRG